MLVDRIAIDLVIEYGPAILGGKKQNDEYNCLQKKFEFLYAKDYRRHLLIQQDSASENFEDDPNWSYIMETFGIDIYGARVLYTMLRSFPREFRIEEYEGQTRKNMELILEDLCDNVLVQKHTDVFGTFYTPSVSFLRTIAFGCDWETEQARQMAYNASLKNDCSGN